MVWQVTRSMDCLGTCSVAHVDPTQGGQTVAPPASCESCKGKEREEEEKEEGLIRRKKKNAFTTSLYYLCLNLFCRSRGCGQCCGGHLPQEGQPMYYDIDFSCFKWSYTVLVYVNGINHQDFVHCKCTIYIFTKYIWCCKWIMNSLPLCIRR